MQAVQERAAGQAGRIEPKSSGITARIEELAISIKELEAAFSAMRDKLVPVTLSRAECTTKGINEDGPAIPMSDHAKSLRGYSEVIDRLRREIVYATDAIDL